MTWNTELNIHQRLLAVMNEVKYIQKEHKLINNQYRAVSHDAVTAKCRAALTAHGVNVGFKINSNQLIAPQMIAPFVDEKTPRIMAMDWVCYITATMYFINADNPQDVHEIDCLGMGKDSQDKATGKAISYTYKYGLLKGLMLETGEDPDMEDGTDYAKPQETVSINDLLTKVKQAQTKQELLGMEADSRVSRVVGAASPAQKQEFKTAFEARLAALMKPTKGN